MKPQKSVLEGWKHGWVNLFSQITKNRVSDNERLNRVLFAAEPKFPKILVPRLPNTPNINTECARKSK